MDTISLPISTLHLDPANLRRHPDRNISAIAASLARFGQQRPIVIDAGNVVRAGNGTLMAAASLGWTEIACVRTTLSGVEAMSYAICDNRTAELAEWEDDLQERLRALAEQDFAAFEATGFEISDLDPMPTSIAEDPPVEPPTDPISRPGDLWICGRHRVLCGDSTAADDVGRLLAGEQPDMMVTDPPYGVNYDPTWRAEVRNSKGRSREGRSKMGAVLNDDRADWYAAWVLFHGHIAYVYHAGVMSGVVQDSLHRAGFETRAQIIWAKTLHALSRGDYHPQHEPCWYAVRKGETGRRTADRTPTTLWTIPARDDSGHGHGTQKPILAMALPLRHHSCKTVYDPFLGSGTTMLAAEQEGYTCYGMEISPVYVDVILRRWEAATGIEPTLDGSALCTVEAARNGENEAQ